MLAAGLAFAAAVLSRWIRWWLLFDPARRPPIGPLGRAFLIGYLLNSILPARPGEVARAVALKRETRTPLGEALATTAAERIYDVLALAGLLLVSAPFLPESRALRTGTLAAGTVAVAAGVTIAVFGKPGGRLERWLERALSLLPLTSTGGARRFAASTLDGLVSLRNARIAAPAALLTAGSWLLLALSAWALFGAFHLQAGFGAAVVVVGAANLSLLVPASPAGVGVFEAATVGVLAGFSVDRSPALSYAVALHGLNLFPYVVAGSIALLRHTQAVRDRQPS